MGQSWGWKWSFVVWFFLWPIQLMPLFRWAWKPSSFKGFKDLHLYNLSESIRVEVVDLKMWTQKKAGFKSSPRFESHVFFVGWIFLWSHILNIKNPCHFPTKKNPALLGLPRFLARLGERWSKSWLHSLRRANIYDPKVSWEPRHLMVKGEFDWSVFFLKMVVWEQVDFLMEKEEKKKCENYAVIPFGTGEVETVLCLVSWWSKATLKGRDMKRLWVYKYHIYVHIYIVDTSFYIPSTFLEYLGLYPVPYPLIQLRHPRNDGPTSGSKPYSAPGTTFGTRRSRTGKCRIHREWAQLKICGALRKCSSWIARRNRNDTSYTALKKTRICLSMRHFNRWFVRSLPRHRFNLRFNKQLAILHLQTTKLEPITGSPRRTCSVLGQHLSVVPSRGLSFSFTPGAGTLYRAGAVSWIILETSKTWKAFAKSDHKHHRNRPCLKQKEIVEREIFGLGNES